MPSPVAHTLAAYSLLITMDPSLVQNRQRNSLALGSAFVFGNLADADFVVAQFSSVTYLRHHYFSHSIPFALLVMAVTWIVLRLARMRSPDRWAGLLGAAYFTHLLLDYMTEDGSLPKGIPLLWPFSTTHFMSPFLIFYSIHRGGWQDIFSAENMLALVVEISVMLPVAVLSFWLARRRAATISPKKE